MTRHPLKTTSNKIKTKYQIGSRYSLLLGYHLSLSTMKSNTVETLLQRAGLIGFCEFSQGSFVNKQTPLKTLDAHTFLMGQGVRNKCLSKLNKPQGQPPYNTHTNCQN